MRFGLMLLTALLLLSGCGAKTEETLFVQDAAPAAVSYTVLMGAPDGAVYETFADGYAYTAENGDYCILAEQVDAQTLEEAIKCVSGFSSDVLEIVSLGSGGTGEYHFAWASCSGEGEMLSRCTLYATDGQYYAVTMTQASECGTLYADTADAVFASIQLVPEVIV
ncbi:MAG: hypothetical protein IIY16_03080 [Oscillospiraceae bacterium]|nr:hypothetical protein [Oscillospiraceae bacterium]